MMYEKEITALGEIKYRKDISKETIETFTRLVKRELPYTILTEKVREEWGDVKYYYCPMCGSDFDFPFDDFYYCPFCGQSIKVEE